MLAAAARVRSGPVTATIKQSRARNVEARPITVPGTIAEELATNPFMRVRYGGADYLMLKKC